jgi:hypothetical protein
MTMFSKTLTPLTVWGAIAIFSPVLVTASFSSGEESDPGPPNRPPSPVACDEESDPGPSSRPPSPRVAYYSDDSNRDDLPPPGGNKVIDPPLPNKYCRVEPWEYDWEGDRVPSPPPNSQRHEITKMKYDQHFVIQRKQLPTKALNTFLTELQMQMNKLKSETMQGKQGDASECGCAIHKYVRTLVENGCIKPKADLKKVLTKFTAPDKCKGTENHSRPDKGLMAYKDEIIDWYCEDGYGPILMDYLKRWSRKNRHASHTRRGHKKGHSRHNYLGGDLPPLGSEKHPSAVDDHTLVSSADESDNEVPKVRKKVKKARFKATPAKVFSLTTDINRINRIGRKREDTEDIFADMDRDLEEQALRLGLKSKPSPPKDKSDCKAEDRDSPPPHPEFK